MGSAVTCKKQGQRVLTDGDTMEGLSHWDFQMYGLCRNAHALGATLTEKANWPGGSLRRATLRHLHDSGPHARTALTPLASMTRLAVLTAITTRALKVMNV